jgi:hypothetical protein
MPQNLRRAVYERGCEVLIRTTLYRGILRFEVEQKQELFTLCSLKIIYNFNKELLSVIVGLDLIFLQYWRVAQISDIVEYSILCHGRLKQISTLFYIYRFYYRLFLYIKVQKFSLRQVAYFSSFLTTHLQIYSNTNALKSWSHKFM